MTSNEINKKLGIQNSSSEKLVKLTLSSSVNGKETNYEVFLNPNQLNHRLTFAYQKKESLAYYSNSLRSNSLSTPTSITSVDPEELTFELMLDGTGATGIKTDVSTEINAISKVTIEPLLIEKKEGAKTKINWGLFEFSGQVQDFDIHYTMFSPSGDPLRALVKLSFIGISRLTEPKSLNRKNSNPFPVDNAIRMVNASFSVINGSKGVVAFAKKNNRTSLRNTNTDQPVTN